MDVKAKLFPFINESSGSNFGQKRADWLISQIPSSRLGEMTIVGPDDDFVKKQKQCLKRCQDAKGILLLSGGDGTVNAWLDLLYESKIPFALLPSGTFNLLAHDFSIPLDPDEALNLAINGKPRPISMGRINNHPFIVSASIGVHSKIIEQREESSDKFGRNRVVALISSTYAALSRLKPFKAQIKLPQETQFHKTSMVMATLSKSHIEPLGIEHQKKLREEAMACFVLKALTWKQMLAVLFKGATGMLGHDKRILVSELDKFELSINRSRLKVCIDGELIKLKSPMKIELVPKALNFIYPADSA